MDFDLNELPVLDNNDIKQESSPFPEPPHCDSPENLANEIEKRLEVGCILESLDLVYVLYCEYAHGKGFSVRKGDQSYFHDTRDIKFKEFECSCEGEASVKRQEKNIGIYQKRVIRTNCKAKIRVAREKRDDLWRVSSFVKEHSHEMVPPEESYLLRSSRNISHSKKTVLEALHSVGIRVSNAMTFMEKEYGGPQNGGFTRKDAYNHIGRLRKTKIECGDANALMKFFIEKSRSEPYFYYDYQMDDDGRLMDFFFRDFRSVIDYEYFGDVLSFDTTYRTNKYNMICAPFVGINHHMTNVMFGMAFLSNETTKSFEWLFKTFLHSMNGEEPGVIFSDQDKAIMSAIDSVFPNSYHRLCQWHINKNAPSHFGTLNSNTSFKKLWYTCMNKCTSAEEFELKWKSMIEGYQPKDKKWFNGMYELRKRWASAFTNDRFSYGLLATSRSEVMNKVLKEMCTKTMSLYEFVLQYESIQSTWRVKESAEDALCLSKPGQLIKKNRLLDHAAEVYTHNVYKAFQTQFVNAMNLVFVGHPHDYSASTLFFQFSSNNVGSSIRQVTFSRASHSVACSCHRWETHGIFCKHILKVYNNMNVTRIPEQYILKRWTIAAKQRRLAGKTISIMGFDPISGMAFVNKIMRSMYELTQTSKCHAGARQLIREMMDQLNEHVPSLLNSGQGQTNHQRNEGTSKSHGATTFKMRDPPKAKTKGSKKGKIQRHLDKNKEKGKRKAPDVK